MPRGARLDAPGALHHVMVRGLNRQVIFRTDQDREDLVKRIGRVCADTGLTVLAWALLPNHFHLLVRTGRLPLAAAMRRLLTGYAVNFNRRQRRVGHVFQNRYKSILVEDDPYLLELVRYIHLNPLRVGLVDNLEGLDRYPWTGHSALLGHVSRSWQGVDEVLGHYENRKATARRAYKAFVRDGIAHGSRGDLQGGGLRRSVGGWEAVASLQRGRERWAADERILGSSEFVLHTLSEMPTPSEEGRRRAVSMLPALLARIAKVAGVTVSECCGGSRRRAVVSARAAVSKFAVRELGLPLVVVARAMGVSPQTVLAGVNRPSDSIEMSGGNLESLLSPKKKPK